MIYLVCVCDQLRKCHPNRVVDFEEPHFHIRTNGKERTSSPGTPNQGLNDGSWYSRSFGQPKIFTQQFWFCRLTGFKYFVGKTNTSGHGPHPLRINTNVAMIRDFICSLKPLWSYPLQCFQVHLSNKNQILFSRGLQALSGPLAPLCPLRTMRIGMWQGRMRLARKNVEKPTR